MSSLKQKDKTLAIVFALFLGGLGAHKFYLNRPFAGIMYAVFFWTFVPACLAMIDVIVLLTMSEQKFDMEYNGQ